MTGPERHGRRRMEGIQVLRAAAAFAVVLHHVAEEALGARTGFRVPGGLITAGAAGVDLFFVISGFVMLHTSVSPSGSVIPWRRFVTNRFVRIYPFYWLICSGMLALGAVGLMASKDFSPGTIAGSLLLWPTPSGLIYVAWTLSYEIYFYAIFASMLILRAPGRIVLSTSAVIAAACLLAPLLPPGDLARFLANPIALEFCFGLCLAWVHLRRPERAALAPAWGLAGLAGLVAAAFLLPHTSTNGLEPLHRTVAWGGPSVLLLASLLSWRSARGPVGRLLVRFGDASYSLYLSHVFVMLAYAKLLKTTALGDVSQLAIMPVVFAAAAGVGLAVHEVAEKPLLRLLRSRRPAAAMPTRGAALT